MKKQTYTLALLLGFFSSYSSIAFARDFQLKDFSGDWVFHSTSSGGVGVNTGPGVSSAVLRMELVQKITGLLLSIILMELWRYIRASKGK
jgi:hypothetical protein